MVYNDFTTTKMEQYTTTLSGIMLGLVVFILWQAKTIYGLRSKVAQKNALIERYLALTQ